MELARSRQRRQRQPGAAQHPQRGTFPVTSIATNAAGCADTITKNVLVNELPQVWAGPDTAICPGDTAHLAASGTALQYFWVPSFANPGAGDQLHHL